MTYQSQTQLYQTTLSHSPGGLPIDSLSGVASIAWSFFTAATISNSTIRNNLISSVHDQFFKLQPNDTRPFPVYYNVNGSNTQGAGNASPAVGAIFAPLALSLSPAQRITIPPFTPPPQATSDKRRSIVGPVAGGVVGGLALLLLVSLGFFYLRRRQNEAKNPYGGPTLNHRDSASPRQMAQRD
ncbi:hypothetical protein QCA50_011524 [Cerrena zonata]|uniref:Uncharacterized protein n=1 Tax=Cerrena zonata TaxID=2478898 RepID=A0AAW0FW83_9APHY